MEDGEGVRRKGRTAEEAKEAIREQGSNGAKGKLNSNVAALRRSAIKYF